MHRAFIGGQMMVQMAMTRAVRRSLQLLVLFGCQERKNLLVRGPVLFLLFSATGHLCRG